MINEKILLDGYDIQNRVVFQPMEGCDCNLDGSPSKLTTDKYLSFAKSGAGIVWMEATAVTPEGRTNLRQMMLTEKNLDAYKKLLDDMRQASIKRNGFAPLLILQLTHSGRQSVKPIIAYRHPIYEQNRPVTDENIATDEYLDTIPEFYAKTTKLAKEAGFDGVDAKCCHGYLTAELMSAFTRENSRYGGSFENRARLLLDATDATRSEKGNMILCSRTGLYDGLVKPYGFGSDEAGNPDWREPLMLAKELEKRGVKLFNIVVGNPYYNSYLNRPYRRGVFGAPTPTEMPQERALGLFEEITKKVKEQSKEMKVVLSGLSYYRGQCLDKADELLQKGVADFAGFGRITLAYPDFYKDWKEGNLDEKKTCVTCSKCTELMRAHCVSGCAVFNPEYRELYKEVVMKKN